MPPKRSYLQHGLSALDGVLKRVEEGEDWTERLGPVGVALRAMRTELLDAIGGADVASPQQHMLVDLIVRTHLLIQSADRYILTMPSPVNKQKRSLFAVVEQRQRLVDSMSRLLGQLGLERRAKPAPTLREYMEQRAAQATPPAEPGSGPAVDPILHG
jgi:hypothetical protein